MASTRPRSRNPISARCTERWLAPIAVASAEVDHASPPRRSARSALASPGAGGSTATTRAPRRRARERRGEREEDGTRDQRHARAAGDDRPTAGVDDERLRAEHRDDVVEAHEALDARLHDARDRRIELARRAFDLVRQRRDRRPARGPPCARERRPRRTRIELADGDVRTDQIRERAEPRRRLGEVERAVHRGRVADRSDEDALPHALQAHEQRVQAIAVRVEPARRGVEQAARRRQIASGQRDLASGREAARMRARVGAFERAGRAPEELSGRAVVAELRHRDPAQRERLGIVPQGDAPQRGERIERRERVRRGSEGRIHDFGYTRRASRRDRVAVVTHAPPPDGLSRE